MWYDMGGSHSVGPGAARATQRPSRPGHTTPGSNVVGNMGERVGFLDWHST
jgi:hypothetical protein